MLKGNRHPIGTFAARETLVLPMAATATAAAAVAAKRSVQHSTLASPALSVGPSASQQVAVPVAEIRDIGLCQNSMPGDQEGTLQVAGQNCLRCRQAAANGSGGIAARCEAAFDTERTWRAGHAAAACAA